MILLLIYYFNSNKFKGIEDINIQKLFKNFDKSFPLPG